MKSNLGKLFKQGLSYPFKMIQGRIQKPAGQVGNLAMNEGALVELNGKKVAAYKNTIGEIIYLSPVCTHLGCLVDWNSVEKTWNCPCHGSKYAADGTLKQGPATRGLDKITI